MASGEICSFHSLAMKM
uniref:Uncharacterized protein n=1 Tax=Anguilla anguilla TaxID=7936 RepID=A0A0E9UT34_ANGAN